MFEQFCFISFYCCGQILFGLLYIHMYVLYLSSFILLVWLSSKCLNIFLNQFCSFAIWIFICWKKHKKNKKRILKFYLEFLQQFVILIEVLVSFVLFKCFLLILHQLTSISIKQKKNKWMNKKIRKRIKDVKTVRKTFLFQ